MKLSIVQSWLVRIAGTILRGSAAAMAGGWLLLPIGASAQTANYTGTGWLSQVPAAGTVGPGLGQMLMRGSVQVLQVECTDPRISGRRVVLTDGAFQSDGSAVMYGPAYLEVSTWAGTNFTPAPNGGMWELHWRGVMQPDYSVQITQVGCGYGGTIEGWRMEETLMRTNASGPYDAAVPYIYAGILRPPPVSNTLLFDSFTNSTGWDLTSFAGAVTMGRSNEQFVLRADWHGVAPSMVNNSAWGFASSRNWCLATGQTLECQADLVSISQTATNLAVIHLGDGSIAYILTKGTNFVSLMKWYPPDNIVVFWADNTVSLPVDNVVLGLELTRDNADVILTVRMLDKSGQNALLFQRSFRDTPAVDASLTSSEFSQQTGITTWRIVSDRGVPLMCRQNRGGAGVAILQVTDGQSPAVEGVFDNYLFRVRDVPPISIARAVQLSWIAPAGVTYSVLGAPAPQGPYTPVEQPSMPGLNCVTVPAEGNAGFYFLRRAP